MYRQARAPAGMLTSEIPDTCLGTVRWMCTRISFRLQSRPCAATGGTGKIAAVAGSLRILKLLSKMCLMHELEGRVLCQDQRDPFLVFTHTFDERFLAVNGRHRLPSVLQEIRIMQAHDKLAL